ncbi:hypothetical protein MKW98_027355, partial [Papaver atlanticum]
TLTQSVFADIPDFTYSRELWQYLANTYAAPTAARSLKLRHQLQTFQRYNLSISAYLAKITSIRDSLLTSSSPLSDVELVLNTLRGLGPDYQAFSTAIETHSTLPSFSEFKSLLLNHEIRLTQYNQPTPDSTPSTAFYGSTFSSSSSSNFQPSRFYNNSGRGNNFYRGGSGGNNGSFRGNHGGGLGNGGRGCGVPFSSSYSFGNQSPQQTQSILGSPPSSFTGSKQPCQICEFKNSHGIEVLQQIQSLFSGS